MMRSTGTVLTAAFSLLLLFGSAAAQAETTIYKWVDKNGETHFSQLPPQQGEAQQIDPDYATPTPAAGSTTPSAAPAPKKDGLKPDQPITVVNKAEAQKACEQAKEQINMLRDPKNQPMVQEKDGKYRSLTADEITGRIKQAEEIANKACAGSQ
ncbi:DUF4124 domain-containing protein [Halothiobacillus sp. DCM-1]|uniref:DUF4124 domain-containing protein n=1 Tax=Halothiobacillus sp. DCM-1 TaxID=3112558 RepID=UPI003244CB21